MREDVSAAIAELELIIEAVRVIGCILPYVSKDDSCFTAKVLYVAVITDDY